MNAGPSDGGRLDRVRLYLIASPETSPPGWRARLESALLSGAVEALQLRVKSWDEDLLLREARRLSELCHARRILFLLNDRPDLAALVEADGAHVGPEDMSPATARALLGDGGILGVSAPDAHAVSNAAGQADYVGLGPCFRSRTKPSARAPGEAALVVQGLEAARGCNLPLFPIGGIDLQNAPLLVAAGADRLAVGAAILDADDPAEAAQRLRSLLPSAPRS